MFRPAFVARLLGLAVFTGQGVVVGANLFADRMLESVATSAALNTVLPATAIRANRPVFANAFVGSVPPTGLETFVSFACGICGAGIDSFAQPFAPATVGDMATVGLTAVFSPLRSAANPAGDAINLSPAFSVDFASSTGLGAVVGTPSVNILGAFDGAPGNVLAGTGFATAATATQFTVNGTYAVGIPELAVPFEPNFWVSTEAADADGNVARHRRLITDLLTGESFATAVPPGIPTVSAPSGPSTGAPAVTFEDRLDPAALFAGGFAILELTATDSAGRAWTVLRQDLDGAGASETVQLPDLSGAGVAGLAVGDWSVQVEAFLLFSATFTPTNYLFEERFRQFATYARTQPVVFTVQ